MEPAYQVQTIDPDTYVIRQSVLTNFEAPFVYLLFGKDRALLFDTGARDGNIRGAVDQLIKRWLKAHHRRDIPLVVAHSHSHGDHIAGDAAFRARPNTKVVGLDPAEVASFFGIPRWPDGVVSFELGGRSLSVIPTPGHQAAAIMLYDPRLHLLFSGDTLYPGRLYVPVNRTTINRASIDRLAAFARTHPIRAVLGAHIEMTDSPGVDYPQRAPAHPHEHRLELSSDAIAQLQTALGQTESIPGKPQIHDDFIVFPVPARPD